jgi:hypothetical protein
MKLSCFSALLAALAMCGVSNAQFVLIDNFDDGAAATRWSAPVWESETGAIDGIVNYAFDYSTAGIPSAPRSTGGSTTGLYFDVNILDDTTGDEGESVGVYSNVLTMPSGDFTLTMDVWFNVNPAFGGTTQYGIFGVYATGANFPTDIAPNDDIPFRFDVSDGDGLAFSVTGDSGAAADFIRFQDANNADAGSQLLGPSFDDIPNGTIPGIVTGAGDPNNPFALPGPQQKWIDVSISSTAGIITFALNGYAIPAMTLDNTGGLYTGGTILLGHSDPFNSAAGAAGRHFLVIDNVLITPEPTSALLGLLGIAGLGARRRR